MASKKTRFAMIWLTVFFLTVAVITQVLAPRDNHIIADEHEWTMYTLQLIALVPGVIIMALLGDKGGSLNVPSVSLPIRAYASIVDGIVLATLATGLAFATYRIRLRLKNKKSP